jgi:carboxymethylenebutenolidase
MSGTDRRIETQEIVCPGAMPAFLARPAATGRYPVVVLIHERYGLVPHTRDLAKKCAGDGFLVIAANYFYKYPDQAALNAGDARYPMTDAESIDYINASLEAVAKNPAADMSRIAVAGYCQTGRHPLVYAAQAKIAAAVVWYGAASKREWPVSDTNARRMDEIIAAVECPVFGAFGSADHIISNEDVQRFRNTLEKYNKSYDIHVYKDAPHGWLNDTMPGRYRAPQADAGWADQQLFLKRVFSGGYKAGEVSWRFDSAFDKDYDFSKNERLE